MANRSFEFDRQLLVPDPPTCSESLHEEFCKAGRTGDPVGGSDDDPVTGELEYFERRSLPDGNDGDAITAVDGAPKFLESCVVHTGDPCRSGPHPSPPSGLGESGGAVMPLELRRDRSTVRAR